VPPTLEDLAAGKPLEAAVVEDFRQNQPGDGIPATSSTTAYLSHDERNLYILFDCRDEPGKVRARLAKREDIADDDQVLVYLDTFRDRRRAYLFAVNPLGVQLDGVLTEGQGTDYSYDTVWYSAARLTDHGFVALIAIPYKSLRFSNDANQTWGVALGRYIPRNSEYSYWPYITSRIEGFVAQMAELRYPSEVMPGRNLQILPYVAQTNARFLDTNLPAFAQVDELRGGVDSKIALSSALTVDLTFNPDFSQVESDTPQVTVNKRYEVFYPEKRPFFMENAGFFQTPETLFYSRRIADPLAGGRFTGKEGAWAVGALVADDRAEGLQYQEGDPLSGRHAGAFVARAQREVGKESFLGLFASDHTFASSSDSALAADARLKLSPNWVFTGQVARSDTTEADGQSLSGYDTNASLIRRGRHLSFSSSYIDRSPDFRAPLGFIKRVDIRQTDTYVSYLWRPDKSAIASIGPDVEALVDWDYKGRLQDWSIRPEFSVTLRRRAYLTIWRSDSYEFFSGLGFREYTNGISVYSARSKSLILSGSFSIGTSPNYSPPPMFPPFLASATNASATVAYNPIPRIRIDQTYFYSRLGAPDTPVLVNMPVAANTFTNHISRTRLNLQVTRDFSVRTIIDYNAVLSTPWLIDQNTTKHLGADILGTYLLNPFTALYVGFTQGFDNLALDSNPPHLRVISSSSTATSRQLFVKVSYLFRL
jgi:hypothetical protein